MDKIEEKSCNEIRPIREIRRDHISRFKSCYGIGCGYGYAVERYTLKCICYDSCRNELKEEIKWVK